MCLFVFVCSFVVNYPVLFQWEVWFVIALLSFKQKHFSFIFTSKQLGIKLLRWLLISSTFTLLLRILALRFGVYCL